MVATFPQAAASFDGYPETILERSETGFGLCRYRLGEAIVIE